MKWFVVTWTVVCALMISGGALAADAMPPVLAAGDQSALWIITRVNDQEFRIHHRNADTEAGVIHPIRTSRGRPIAAAAADGSLYLVYADKNMQRIRVVVDEATGLRRDDIRQLAPLPPEVNFVALAATRRGPVVLVTTPDNSPDDDDADAADPAAPSPYTLLTSTTGGTWQSIPTPAGLHAARTPRLVVTHPDDSPRIHIVDRAENARVLVVHQHQADDTWQSTLYTQPVTPAHQLMAPMNLMVLVDRAGPSQLAAYVLRDGRVLSAGQLDGATFDSDKPTVVAWQGRPAALVAYSDEQFVLSSRDLTESANTDATSLTLAVKPWPSPPFNREMLMLALLIVMVVFVMATWRRDPRAAMVDLPKGLEPAELSKRIFAAAIDLALPTLIAMMVFNIGDPSRILANWPSPSGDMTAMKPGALIILLFVAHTMLTEMFTGTSLGKKLIGLRIVTTHGQRPRPTQVLIRNAVKIIELVAWFLLLFMILNPAKQRMGDLAARTVVITGQPEGDPEKPDETDKQD